MRLKVSLLFSAPVAALMCIFLAVAFVYDFVSFPIPPSPISQSAPTSLASSLAAALCISSIFLLCATGGMMIRLSSMALPTLRSLSAFFDRLATSVRLRL